MSSEQYFRRTNLVYAPLLLPTFGLMAGIILGYKDVLSVWVAIACGYVGLVLYLLVGVRASVLFRYVLIFWVSVCFGIIHFYRYNCALPANHIKYFVDSLNDEERIRVALSGYVYSEPMIDASDRKFPYHSKGRKYTRLIISAKEIKTSQGVIGTEGLVLGYITGVHDEFVPGEGIEVSGFIGKVREERGKGLFGKSDVGWFFRNRIFAVISVNNVGEVKIAGAGGFAGDRLIYKLRQVAQSFLLQADSRSYGFGLSRAVLLGDRNKVENELNDAFLKIGAAHFLAVSGLHLWILLSGIWVISLVAGFSRRNVIVIVVLSALAYLVLANARPSLVRATIMIGILCFGYIRHKRTDIVNAMCAAALIMLVLNPNQLFQVGFQLSFITLLGIVILARPIYYRLFSGFSGVSGSFGVGVGDVGRGNEGKGRFLFYWLVDKMKMIFAASLAASIASLPIVMKQFNIVSLAGPVSAVLLLLPVMFFVFVGFFHLVISSLLPVFSFFSAFLLGVVGKILAGFALLLSHLPGTYVYVDRPGWAVVGMYYLVLFWPLRVRISGEESKRSSGSELLRDRFGIGRIGEYVSYDKVKLKVILLSVVVLIYLTHWVISAGIIFGGDRNRFLYVPRFREGQTIGISTGKHLLLIDCGCDISGQIRDFLRRVSAKYVIKPVCVLITSVRQNYFCGLWEARAFNPDMQVFITPMFEEFKGSYWPVKLLSEDTGFRLRKIAMCQKIAVDDVCLTVLDEGDKGKTSAMILVEFCGKKIFVCPVLTKYSMLRVYSSWPGLKADIVICGKQTRPSDILYDFLHYICAKRLIVCGRVFSYRKERFFEIAKRDDIRVSFPVSEGGTCIFF